VRSFLDSSAMRSRSRERSAFPLSHRSCNALANEKELLRTAIVAADAKGDQLSARADGLVADLDTLRAEKATLEGHSIMLEQDLSTTRGQLSIVKSSLEEEKGTTASLQNLLDAEKE
jgi:hypothetical protein